MHELSLCQALIEQVDSVARRHGAVAVHRIRLSIGPLSGVEPDLLAHAYALAKAGTVAENAELELVRSPVTVHCTDCGAETDVAPNRLRCGACGTNRVTLASGDELLLMHVEMTAGESRKGASHV